MSKPEKPTTGGSYVRNKDGTLTRSGGTAAAPALAAASAMPVQAAPADTVTDQPKSSAMKKDN